MQCKLSLLWIVSEVFCIENNIILFWAFLSYSCESLISHSVYLIIMSACVTVVIIK